MFHLQSLLKKLKGNAVLRENRRIVLMFFLFSLVFAVYMVLVEGMSIVDTYYFLVTTATTVGYGDFSPQTTIGKFLGTAYMVVGIALLGIFLGKVTDMMVRVIFVGTFASDTHVVRGHTHTHTHKRERGGVGWGRTAWYTTFA